MAKSANKIETLPQDKIDVFRKLGETVETPAYVAFESDLERSLKPFLDIQPEIGGRVVRLAFKANSSSALASWFYGKGVQFDASSMGEVRRLHDGANIPYEAIRLTSQKVLTENDFHLIRSRAKDLNYTATSLRQLEQFGEHFPRRKVGVRFNLGIGSGWNPKMSTGGQNSSFGIYQRENEIDSILKKYGLVLDTVHFHIGSGNDPKEHAKAFGRALEIVERYPSVKNLDAGGGYKVARMNYEHGTDMARVGKVMTRMMDKFNEETGRGVTLEVEPGTALVANAEYLLGEIFDQADNSPFGGANIFKVNFGMNQNTRVSLYAAQHPLIVIPRDPNDKRKQGRFVHVGPTCESGDGLTVEIGKSEVMAKRLTLEPRVGDLMVMTGAGAYCASMNTAGYNSEPACAEYFVRKNGDINLIREKQPLEELWKHERIPSDLRVR